MKKQKMPSKEAEDADEAEFEALAASGGSGGARSGALALLAVVVVVIGIVHYHFAAGGREAFVARLDSELVGQARLNLDATAGPDGGRMTVVPSWPLRLYSALRRDIAVYVCFGLFAAWLWARSAALRARRDAWLVQRRLSKEIIALRQLLDKNSKHGTIRQERGKEERSGEAPAAHEPVS